MKTIKNTPVKKVKPETMRATAVRLLVLAQQVKKYNPEGATKEDWLNTGRAFLKQTLALLGEPGEVYLCKGGPGVSGESCLRTDRVYVCLTGFSFSSDPPKFYYRTTVPRGDRGQDGANNWMTYAELVQNPEALADRLRGLTG